MVNKIITLNSVRRKFAEKKTTKSGAIKAKFGTSDSIKFISSLIKLSRSASGSVTQFYMGLRRSRSGEREKKMRQGTGELHPAKLDLA